jgi:hypothetical protein
METLLHIWILTVSGLDPMGNFCDDRHTPLQSIKAHFPYSTSTGKNFEEKKILGKAGNSRDNKIKATGQRMWTGQTHVAQDRHQQQALVKVAQFT